LVKIKFSFCFKSFLCCLDVCQEKNSIEDTLRSKFEYELKIKLDDLHRIFEQDKQIIQRKYNQDFEQQSKEFLQEIDRINIKHEKQIIELNNELDGLRTNDDTKNRLVYVEKEFEQLKHDYYDLNIKQSELLKTCSILENENINLLNSIQRIEEEKFQLTEYQKQTDQNQINLKENIESLQLHIKNYENVINQYEEYRIKLENNLQKITQQRDSNKVELRLTKEMLTNKEDDYNQLKIHFEQSEKRLQNHQEQFRQYETTINDLERQIQSNTISHYSGRFKF
jgi:chromosome segregation ATPase